MTPEKIRQVFSKADHALAQGRITPEERSRILIHYYGTDHEHTAIERHADSTHESAIAVFVAVLLVFAVGFLWMGGDTVGFVLREDPAIMRVAITERLAPGTVVELDTSGVRKSEGAYAKRVTGIVLDATEHDHRVTIAGPANVKANDENGPIAVGDLLVTSSAPGEAMRCDDQQRCFGAILGKAMEPLDSGTDMIDVMVVLG